MISHNPAGEKIKMVSECLTQDERSKNNGVTTFILGPEK